eukprot:CAMPEP_0194275836 /NCGR_PEP_ID=MMETSP0169-20130528/8576_1 /TAXON_ID=218684 /ORGANISM="Corethron pennatum, Strain L29A3" /LENGTH=517 /DNA_ID=CAMNT_0039019401 /DNA_START=201 /DNA_END=1754 /DNA_ORIENTATION=+
MFGDEIANIFKRICTKLKCNRPRKTSLPFEHDTCTDIPGFFRTNRTEENFIRNNTCPKLELPCPYVAEYIPIYDYKIRGIIRGLRRVLSYEKYGWDLVAIFCFSLGWGFIGSAIATIIQLRIKYEIECVNTYFNLTDASADIAKSFESILDDYKFLPIFLIVAYVGFVADRWRDWLVNCHSLQGRIHSFGLMCGSAVAKPPDIVVRKHLYKIYRYLNCLHAITYQSVSIELDDMQIENEFIDVLNLLTKEEVERLVPMDNKMRDCMVGWLGIEAISFLKHDSVAGKFVAHSLMDSLKDLRGIAGNHHDLFIQDRANSFTTCMRYFIFAYIFLIIFSYPFTLSISEGNMCLQPMVLRGILVNTSFLQIIMMVAAILRHPFCFLADPVKVSSFLAGTERCLFANMRGTFVEEDDDPKDDPSFDNHQNQSFAGELPDDTVTRNKFLKVKTLLGEDPNFAKVELRQRKPRIKNQSMRRQSMRRISINAQQNSDTAGRLSDFSTHYSRRKTKSIDPTKARDI